MKIRITLLYAAFLTQMFAGATIPRPSTLVTSLQADSMSSSNRERRDEGADVSPIMEVAAKVVLISGALADAGLNLGEKTIEKLQDVRHGLKKGVAKVVDKIKG